jgi:hypothetical protein
MDIIEMKSTVIPTEATTDTEITMIIVMEDMNIAIKIVIQISQPIIIIVNPNKAPLSLAIKINNQKTKWVGCI